MDHCFVGGKSSDTEAKEWVTRKEFQEFLQRHTEEWNPCCVHLIDAVKASGDAQAVHRRAVALEAARCAFRAHGHGQARPAVR